MRPSHTITAPTIGLGATLHNPFFASSIQRLMYFSSSILVLFAILFLLLHSETVNV